MQTIDCDRCGESFERYASRINDGHNFCSSECNRAWNTERFSGDENPNPRNQAVLECEWCGDEFEVAASEAEARRCCSIECENNRKRGEEKQMIECDWCGEEFYRKPSGREQNDGTYCSKDCGYKGERDGRPTEWECDWCGDTYYSKPSDRDGNDHNFCSRECHGAWQAEHRVGENHPNYTGDWKYNSPDQSWKQRRREVMERDDHQCQACGEGLADAGRRAQVHHIIPYRKFEQNDVANRMENLVLLCRTCHNRWEGIPLRPALV